MEIKDSGNRREFGTGAVRDIQEGKGRCDLMPLSVIPLVLDDCVLAPIQYFKETSDFTYLSDCIKGFCEVDGRNKYEMMLELAKHFEQGAVKYGENNWQKGIPVHCYIDSSVRHYLKYRAGWTDEPHDRAFVWNLVCCIWTMQHHQELDDFTQRGKENEKF